MTAELFMTVGEIMPDGGEEGKRNLLTVNLVYTLL